MFNWYEENGKHLGFVDGDYLYRVAKDENGWFWEYVPDADGMDGYATAQEAMEAAMQDFLAWHGCEEEEEWEPLSLEEIKEILGDLLYEERKEENMMMGW